MHPDHRPHRLARRILLPVLLLCGLVAAIVWRPGSPDEAAPSAVPGKVSPRPAAAAPLPEEPAVAATPGHEGHGDECAHCLGERKLALYREDYAALLLARTEETAAPDPAQEDLVLAACRRVAAAVLTEWSFSESRPLLPPDDVVEARRREILGPVLASLPPKPADP